LKRRTLVISGVTALVGGLVLRAALSNEESAVSKILYKRLHYLSLDSRGVAKFARDLVWNNEISHPKLLLLDAAGAMYTHIDRQFASIPNDDIRRGEERVVGLFLLSSDFFVNGADETRIVRYLSYFHATTDIRPCSNPFARPVLAIP
jgi:hypothetical protein